MILVIEAWRLLINLLMNAVLASRAERLLEMKEAELFSANRKLGLHARALSDRIERTEAEVANVRSENRQVKSDLSVAHQKVEVAERRLWHSIRAIRDGFAFFNARQRNGGGK